MQSIRLEKDGVATQKIRRTPNGVVGNCDTSVDDPQTRMLLQATMVRACKKCQRPQLLRAIAERNPYRPEAAHRFDIVRILVRLRDQIGMRRENATGIGSAQA